MSERTHQLSLLRIIIIHGVSFALALSPILLGGAFGNAEARLGVYSHAVLIAQKLFSTDIFWNDFNAWGSISAPFGYEFQPLFLLLLLFLKPVSAVHALTFLYAVTAAICATVFLRREGWTPWTSLFGGTVYAFILWSWIFEPSISVVPPLLIITLLAFQSGDRHPFIASAAATISLALLWLGSHVQFAVMALALSWMYLLFLILRGGRWRRILAVGIGASLVSFLIALVRLLPLIAHVALSTRAPLTALQTADFNFPLFLFLPRLPFLFPGTSPSYQVVPYMGAFAGACVLLALTRIRRHRLVQVLVVVALIPLFISLPGVSAVVLAVPFVSLLGPPGRWLFISMVVLIPVACLGLDVLVSRTKRGIASIIGWLFGGIGIALLSAIIVKCTGGGLFLCVPQSHLLFPSLSLILTGIVFLTLFFRPMLATVFGALSVLLVLFGMMIEWRIPASAVRGTPLFLPATAQEIVHVFAARSAQTASLSPRARALYEDTFFTADANLLSGVALTAANDPTLSQRTQTVLDLLGAEPPFSPTYATATPAQLTERLRSFDFLLSALGVHWVLSPVPLENLDTLKLQERYSIGGEASVYRYAVRNPRPSAYVLPAVSLFEPALNDLPERLRASSARQRAMVECDGCHGEETSSGKGTFVVREENPARIRIDVQTPDNQWMAVRCIAQPGTEVSIDGRIVPYGIADGLLVTVRVPRGTHIVTVTRTYGALLRDSLRLLRGKDPLFRGSGSAETVNAD
ncbi:MAG: hypothetical protein V1876_03200 [Candidatus Peregrinibacteria bacterium]